MVAKSRKAPNAKIESSQSRHSDISTPVSQGSARRTDLDIRAQSTLLKEAFETLEPAQFDRPEPTASPARAGVATRLGWRAFKSAVEAARIVPGTLPGTAGVVGAVATFRIERGLGLSE